MAAVTSEAVASPPRTAPHTEPQDDRPPRGMVSDACSELTAPGQPQSPQHTVQRCTQRPRLPSDPVHGHCGQLGPSDVRPVLELVCVSGTHGPQPGSGMSHLDVAGVRVPTLACGSSLWNEPHACGPGGLH